MGIFSSIKRGIGRGWQVKKWADYDGMKSNAKYVKSLWDGLTPGSDTKPEDASLSFEETMKKYNMTEAQLPGVIKRYKTYAKCYTVASVIAFGYAVYLLTQSSYFSFISCSVIALLILSYAFRQSYFSYMLAHRSTKPNIKEWWSLTFSKKHK